MLLHIYDSDNNKTGKIEYKAESCKHFVLNINILINGKR